VFSVRRWQGGTGRFVALAGLLVLIGLGGWLIAVYCLAEYHLRHGREALAKQRLPLARKHLLQAKRFRPRSSEIELLLARLSRQQRLYEEAQDHLRRYSALGGGDTQEVQLEQLMLRAQMGDGDEVFYKLWAYVDEKTPQAPLVLEALSANFLLRNYPFQALGCLSQWKRIDPDNVQRLLYTGWYDELQENTIGARDNYRRALTLDPERTDIRLRLAVLLAGQQQDKEAVAEFQRILEQAPGNLEARIGVARGQRSLGLNSQARENLEAVLREAPENATALRELGWVALDEGKIAEAESLLHKALQREPADHDALYNIVICLRRLGRTADAEHYAQKLQQVEKDRLRLRALLRRELVAQPSNSKLAYEAATIYTRLGRPTDALPWLSRVLAVDANHQGALRLLVEYLEKQGEKDRAQEFRERLQQK
jgi:tetratricopeptide (TPR) repeat protein